MHHKSTFTLPYKHKQCCVRPNTDRKFRRSGFLGFVALDVVIYVMSNTNRSGENENFTLCVGYLTTTVKCIPPIASTKTLSVVAFMPSTRAAALPVISHHMITPINDTDLVQLMHSAMSTNKCIAVVSLPENCMAILEVLTGSRSLVLSVLHSQEPISQFQSKTTKPSKLKAILN